MKRLKAYRDNYWCYSEPVAGLSDFKKIYPWPKDLRHLCNIVRVLNEYYEIGLYDIAQVAMFIYKKWGARIRKHCDGLKGMSKDLVRVEKEFRARGFVERDTLDFDNSDSWIETIGLEVDLAHPEVCWHHIDDKDICNHYIYTFFEGMLIQGYTRARIPPVEKIKRR